jgi:hypothetical protein
MIMETGRDDFAICEQQARIMHSGAWSAHCIHKHSAHLWHLRCHRHRPAPRHCLGILAAVQDRAQEQHRRLVMRHGQQRCAALGEEGNDAAELGRGGLGGRGRGAGEPALREVLKHLRANAQILICIGVRRGVCSEGDVWQKFALWHGVNAYKAATPPRAANCEALHTPAA